MTVAFHFKMDNGIPCFLSDDQLPTLPMTPPSGFKVIAIKVGEVCSPQHGIKHKVSVRRMRYHIRKLEERSQTRIHSETLDTCVLLAAKEWPIQTWFVYKSILYVRHTCGTEVHRFDLVQLRN